MTTAQAGEDGKLCWIARVMVFAGPAAAFILTRRICLGLQRKDKELLEHGLETGIIRQLPDGQFIEVHRPLTEQERAPLQSRKVPALMPAPGSRDDNGVPAAQMRGLTGRARAIANRGFAETIVLQPNGHGHQPAEPAAGKQSRPAGATRRPAQPARRSSLRATIPPAR